MEITARRLLTLSEVSEITRQGKTKIYGKIAAGTFPAQVKNGAQALWFSDEIDEWIDNLQKSRGENG